jgi:hypothetical protein
MATITGVPDIGRGIGVVRVACGLTPKLTGAPPAAGSENYMQRTPAGGASG